MTDPLDFSSFEEEASAPRPAAANVKLRFFIEPVESKAKSLEAGRPIYDNIEMVSIINPGSRDEFIKKVDDSVKAKYGLQYERWKKTQEQPTDGTPLELVPFLNPGQIREYRAININSLEHLAQLSDAMVQKIGMGGAETVRKAKAYLESAKGSAETQRLTARILELERENARLKENIIQVNARYEAAMQGLPAPITNGLVPSGQVAPGSIDMHALAAMVAQQLKGQMQ